MALDLNEMRHGTELLKRGFAKMQEGGVIMDVVTPEQAQIADDAGATAVMALERVPADIRAMGGVARMSHPDLIKGIIETTSIPVMAKARIGHDEEARVLEALGVDMVDESEVINHNLAYILLEPPWTFKLSTLNISSPFLSSKFFKEVTENM